MDNRILQINGPYKPNKDQFLRAALEMAFTSEWSGTTTCPAWAQTIEDGLVLCSLHENGKTNLLPAPLNVDGVLPMVKAWLASPFTEKVNLGQWLDDADHDGSNGPGFYLYVNDWGNVGNFGRVICAIKPAFMWYGK